MSEGLMWWPDKGEDFEDEIQRAVKRFYERFEEHPTACRMACGDGLEDVHGIKMVPDLTITPGLFLLTAEEIKDEA